MDQFIPFSAKPQCPVGAQASAEGVELEAYARSCEAIVAAQAATAPPPNTVIVQPGGQSYTSISAAIAATQPNPQVQPVLFVGPGTYNEQVVLKSYLHIQGSGVDQTTITFPASSDAFGKGTVVAASNASITNCSVIATGNGWGSNATALDCGGATPFSAGNCNFTATDNGQSGINLITISIDFNARNPGNSKLYLNYCVVKAVASQPSVYPTAVIGYGGAYAEAMTCKFITSLPPSGFSWGVASALNSAIQIVDSYIEAATWALTINQPPAKLKAIKCQINGPVSSGVVVQN